MRRVFVVRWLTSVIGVCLLLWTNSTVVQADGLPFSTLKVSTINGETHTFKVEVAASAPTRGTGLMNRRSLAEGTGMIFIFPKPKQVMMWMKDTLVPLDMLFIDASGHVINIAENARPMDETNIPSKGLAAYVLELSGGSAKRLHLAPGDKVGGPALNFKARD
jgi:hypothetical protein